MARIVAVDSSMLLLFLSSHAGAPVDPGTGRPTEFSQERLQYLVQALERDQSKVVVPTPALSEVLVHAGAARDGWLALLQNRTVFRIAPFDSRAAIELAIMTRSALDAGSKKSGLATSWGKVKFDRQIVAIAKVEAATILYSDDQHMQALGLENGLTVVGLASCPLPPHLVQRTFGLSGEPPSQA